MEISFFVDHVAIVISFLSSAKRYMTMLQCHVEITLNIWMRSFLRLERRATRDTLYIFIWCNLGIRRKNELKSWSRSEKSGLFNSLEEIFKSELRCTAKLSYHLSSWLDLGWWYDEKALKYLAIDSSKLIEPKNGNSEASPLSFNPLMRSWKIGPYHVEFRLVPCKKGYKVHKH